VKDSEIPNKGLAREDEEDSDPLRQLSGCPITLKTDRRAESKNAENIFC
jgi:hypothetical protein